MAKHPQHLHFHESPTAFRGSSPGDVQGLIQNPMSPIGHDLPFGRSRRPLVQVSFALISALMVVSLWCTANPAGADARELRVTPANEMKFNPLNPELGDKGPQVSVVFGEMNTKGAVGFLLKVPAGATPGPHIHSSDSYVVVLGGKVHNFEPGPNKGKAVGNGGVWFQPANVAHDNYCEEGADCMIFVYAPGGNSFIPIKDAYQNPALAPAMRVMTANEVKFAPMNPDAGNKGPIGSVLFGNMEKPGPLGLLLEVPAGRFGPGPHTHSSDLYLVGLSGRMHTFEPSQDKGKAIGVGGTWFQPADVPHDNYCEGPGECTFFVYLPDGLDVKPVK